LVVLSWAGPLNVAAQNTVPNATAASPDSTAWWFSFSPYLWAAGQKGQVGVSGSVVDVDLGLGDVVDQMDLAFTGMLEARHSRWIGRIDLQYFSLTDDSAVTLTTGSAGTVNLSQDQVISQPELGYTLLIRPWGGVDGLAGVRYWHLSADLDANSGGAQVATVSGSHEWLDGTIGARLRFAASPVWQFWVKGDVGGGASEFTWLAMGAASYHVGRCCSILGLYRHLDVDYRNNGFVDDVYLTGPALGVEIRF
jgi:hypothetical protein